MCTDLLVADPSSPTVVIAARSMEYERELNSTLTFHAKGDSVTGQGDVNWVVQYNYIAVNANAANLSFAVEGMNTAGLSVSALYFKGFAKFPGKGKGQGVTNINVTQFVDYLLANYSSAKQAISDVNTKQLGIWAEGIQQSEFPLHFSLHDQSGYSGVIEFTKKKKNIERKEKSEYETLAEENPTKVFTNAPDFNWHLNNLGYYASLSPTSTKVKVGEKKYPLSGVGNGLRGIPGDSYPASRFVRTYYNLTNSTTPTLFPTDADGAVQLAVHLLNNVDIAIGQCADFPTKDSDKEPSYDHTQWIVIKDLFNNNFYYRTYKGLGLSVINLNKVDWTVAKNGAVQKMHNAAATAQNFVSQ